MRAVSLHEYLIAVSFLVISPCFFSFNSHRLFYRFDFLDLFSDAMIFGSIYSRLVCYITTLFTRIFDIGFDICKNVFI